MPSAPRPPTAPPPPRPRQVCLSLLGTFNSANATEKWDPAVSTLFQVAVSIQSQILVPHPCQNEPGYEGVAPDSAESREYNAKLRLYTMRHAMLGALRSPPAGFEDVAAAHFASLRDRILDTCRGWLAEAPDDLRPRYLAALAQLHAALPPRPDGAPPLRPHTGAAAAAPSLADAAAAGAAAEAAGEWPPVVSAGGCDEDAALYG